MANDPKTKFLYAMSKPNVSPPHWADWLLEKLLHGDALEEIQGDLHESFLWRLEERGARYAKWHFIKEILQSIRFSNLKPYPVVQQLITLFSSHFKTGWRFIWKTKGYSAINILGLSIGIVFSWFAYQYATDQFGYNKHLRNVDDLYHSQLIADMMGTSIYFPGSSYKAGITIKDELPEVLDVAMFAEEKRLLKVADDKLQQSVLSTNKTLLDFLNLHFLEGGMNHFNDPVKAILSERMAFKLGIRGKAVGQLISLSDSVGFTTYQVVGVFRDLPENTSIRAEVVLPLSDFLKQEPNRLTDFNNMDLSHIYQFAPNANAEAIKDKITDVFNRQNEGNHYRIHLNAVADFHLTRTTRMGSAFTPQGDKQLITFIIIAGLLCLLISIINYANFSISLYINRTREMAVRKVMGAGKLSVFQQLMTEAFLTTLLATIVAVFLYLLVAPEFSLFVEKTFSFNTLIDARFIPGNIALLLIIALMSGVYPAFLLSRFEIVKSLKGIQNMSKGKGVMKSLLTLQFTISIVMIVSMFIFRGQLQLIVNHDKGYDFENVVRIKIPDNGNEQAKVGTFLSSLSQLSIMDGTTGSSGFNMTQYDDNDLQFGLLNMAVDSNYFNVMGLRLIEGQSFSTTDVPPSKAVIVNQALVQQLNLHDPIGKSIAFSASGGQSAVIVGVIEDYFNSPRLVTGGVLFYPQQTERTIFDVYLKSSQTPQVLEAVVQPLWDELFFPAPFQYSYLQDEFERSISQEVKIAKISSMGSFLAIFIAAFGLLGLVGITIKQKLKRVSISRILGASIGQVASLISKKFLAPILVSLTVGLAVSVYLTQQWLEKYPVRINVEWYHLTLASLIIISILLLVVWIQVKTALNQNPVIYLKED